MITAKQAKQARGFCGLSQGTIVADTGINRSYLSKFENGHMLLPEVELMLLEEYYAGRGWKPEDPPKPGSSEKEALTQGYWPHFRDGIQIPDNFDEDFAESLLDELRDNDRFIEDQMAIVTPKKESWLSEDTVDLVTINSHIEAIKNRMIRNYCIVRQLHGRDCLLMTPANVNVLDVESGEAILPKIGHYLGFRFRNCDFQKSLAESESFNIAAEVEPIV